MFRLNKYISSPALILSLVFILIRIALTTAPSFKVDMGAWQAWAGRLFEVFPWNFYAKDIWTNYTPGYLIILWILGNIFNLAGISVFSSIFEVAIKTITNIFDVATALLIAQIAFKYSGKKWASLAFFSYLINPAVIFNSSVWGQIDGILTFFTLLAFYLLLEMKLLSFSLLSFAFALLIKPQTIAFIPVYLLALYFRHNINQIVKASLPVLVFLLTINLLFFLKDPLLGFLNLFLQMTKDYPYTSLFAFNFWALVGFWKSDLTKIIFSYKTWGIILLFVTLGATFLPIISKNKYANNQNFFYLISALSIFAFFLFPTRIHERYLFPFFAFFLVSLAILKSYKLLAGYAVLSIFHLANLWYVYFYYQYVYPNPNFAGYFLYDYIDKLYPYLSVFNIFFFVILLIINIRIRRK